MPAGHYYLPVSTSIPFLLRWYYVNPVLTTLVLRQSGSYYVGDVSLPRPLTATFLLRKFLTCSKFDYILAVFADIITLLPRFYYAHPTLPRSSGSHLFKPSANGRQKTRNKCETQNEIVSHIRLRHPETINSAPLNSVSRIKQTDVQPVLHLEVSCFGIAHTVNKTSSKH